MNNANEPRDAGRPGERVLSDAEIRTVFATLKLSGDTKPAAPAPSGGKALDPKHLMYFPVSGSTGR